MMRSNISIDTASELLRYSHNEEGMSTTFHLSLDEFGSSAGIKFVGAALRHNNTIEWLFIDLCGKTVPEESLVDLLAFISNCPSLRYLKLHIATLEEELMELELQEEKEESAQLARRILNSSAQNGNIETISVHWLHSVPLQEENWVLPVSKELKCLALHGLPEGLQDMWPNIHRIKSLNLEKTLDEHRAHQRKQTNLLRHMESSTSSQSIETLVLFAWSPSIPTLLLSARSTLQSLSLQCADFRHTVDGCTPMDGLLWGLSGSRTTDLTLSECQFDPLAVHKLWNALQSQSLKKLQLFDMEGLDGESMAKILACESLEELSFEYDPSLRTESVSEALVNCKIPTLAIGNSLAGLGTALKAATTSGYLRKLRIFSVTLDDEDANLIECFLADEDCKLQHLSLERIDYDNEPETQVSLFQALGENQSLKSFRWGGYGQPSMDTICGLLDGAGKAKNLTVLDVSFYTSYESHSPLDGRVTEVVSRNWKLEEVGFVFVDYSTTPCTTKPATIPSVDRHMQSLCARNKMKKKIGTTPTALNLSEKGSWMEEMQSMWDLPDGLTLAFNLLQLRPGCFF